MTVRELIEHLQTLDQDKGIWILYDSCDYYEPTEDDTVVDLDKWDYEAGVRKGDYIITVG